MTPRRHHRRRRGLAFHWALCAGLLLSCGTNEEPLSSKAPSDAGRHTEAGETRSPLYETIPISSPGTIRGTVRLVGNLPVAKDIPIDRDQDVCGTAAPNPSLHVGPGGEVEDAVVFLKGVSRGKPLEPLRRGVAEVEIVKCRLIPHLLVVPQGTILELVNSDPLLHDVEGTLESDHASFELVLPMQHFRARRKLERVGPWRLMSAIGYSWMRAYVFVQEHPYYARTDDHGSFLIEGIPPGRYSVVVWHEWLGEQQRWVQLEGGAILDVVLELALPGGGRDQ